MLSLAYSVADQNFARGKSLGILNVSLDLLHHLAQRDEVEHLTVLSNRTLAAQMPASPRARVENHDAAIASSVGRMAWDQWGVYRAAARAGCDWLLLPKGYASIARSCHVRLAAVVHDAMSDHYRRNYPASVSRLESAYFDRSLSATLRKANVIFTNSDFTAAETLRVARDRGIAPPPILTMGIGFSAHDQVLSRLGIGARERRGILLLTSRWPHKRTGMAIRLLATWQQENKFDEDIHLVGSLPDDLSAPGGNGWKIHPRMSNESYAALMSSVRVVLFVSDYEGFGMPPVEAAMAGACPVYSDLPVTREVMQGAGFAFINENYESFARAMNSALQTPAGVISGWAQGLQQRHHWSAVCDRVVAGLQKNSK